MSKIRQALYLEVLRVILICFCVYFSLLYGLKGLSLSSFLTDGIYVFLILFLRSTYISSVWNLRLKWTVVLLPALEAMMYGGGLMGHIVAGVSLCKFIVHYGYVLNWNPVFPTKDSFGNHLLEVLGYSLVLCVFAPLKIQTFLLLVVLSVQSFYFQWKLVDNVAGAVETDVLPARWTEKAIPIEVWFLSYIGSRRNMNLLPPEVVDRLLLSEGVAWELRRLVVRSVGSNPTRAQMKQLVDLASVPLVHSVSKRLSSFRAILVRGPLAPVSTEPDTRLLTNEAIAALTRLHKRLGESKFSATFDKTSEAKIALDLVRSGFRS